MKALTLVSVLVIISYSCRVAIYLFINEFSVDKITLSVLSEEGLLVTVSVFLNDNLDNNNSTIHANLRDFNYGH